MERPSWLKKTVVWVVLAGFGIVLVGATVCSQQPAAQPVHASDAVQSQTNPGATAVLFLIDESGGVSGKCPQPGQVLVTDSAGLRYDVVRFFITLWEAYYSDRWLLPGVSGIHSNLADLHVGVMQFADGLAESSLLPFTLALKLSSSDEWNLLYHQSRFSEEMLRGHSSNWFCYTKYPEVASQLSDLFPPESSRRILVLLTDGSFRGATERARDTAREDAQKALEGLSGQGVEVYVLLLGKSMCPTHSDCQEISQVEHTRRAVDLKMWEALGGSGTIAVLDEQNPFESTGSALDSLLPGRLFQTGWLNGVSSQPLPLLWGYTERTRVVAITSQPPNTGALQLRDENNLGIPLDPQREQWLQGDKELPAGTPDCQPRAPWELVSHQDMSVYYWIVPDHDVPGIRSLEVSPEQVVLNENRHIVVTTHLGGRTNCRDCYRLVVTVGDDVDGVQEVNLGEVSDLIPLEFDLPLELDWGPLPVRVQLTYEQSSEIPLGFQQSSVPIRFQPQVGEVSMTRPDHENLVTITVPIQYAAKVPDFEAHFALFPDRFDDPPPPVLPQSDECSRYKSLEDAEYLVEIHPPKITAEGSTFRYQLTVPCQVISGTCDYHYLRVRWTGEVGEQTHWVDLGNVQLSTPIPCPTSSPTPPVTPTPQNGGDGLCSSAHPALVSGAAICVLNAIRKRGKSCPP
jgi:hypothetical protein